MRGWNKWIIGIEWGLILLIFCSVILPHWNREPVVKDYFALLIIGELILESWSRIKQKRNNNQ